jgi:alpha-mannosidase
MRSYAVIALTSRAAKLTFFALSGVLILGGLAAAEDATTAKVKLTVVNVASHCDWSWVHTRAWHESRYAQIIHDYLLLMRKNPKLVWQLETVNEQLLPFLVRARQQWPEMIDEFWQRVREGRIEVVSGYSNPRLSEVYPELFVRSLVLGKQYFRRHVPGIKQEVFEDPDLMCGTSQVPQILSLAGYRYFMFTRPCGQQAEFWRRGIDGTRILACKDVYGYPEMQGKPGTAFPGIKPLPVWRYAVGCDDLLPTQAMLDQALADNKKTLTSMLRFFQECEKYADQMTELSGSLDSCNYYTMAGMHGSENLHTLHNQNEDLLLSLEKAQAMAALAGRPFYSEPVDSLWQEALSTCGHAIEWCWKEDYVERMAQGRHTREKARRFLEEALCAMAGGAAFAADRGTPLVVFNFQNWPVSGPVEFAVAGPAEGLELADSDGKPVPLQFVTDGFGGDLRATFNATAVPACGMKTYYVRPAKSGQSAVATPSATTGDPAIENETYRITVRSGGRLEVFDKSRNVNLGTPQQGGFGDPVLYDMPPTDTWTHIGPPGKRRDWKADEGKWRVVQGPAYASIVMPGKIGGHAVTRVVRLRPGSRRIEFGIELNTALRDNAIFCIRFPIGMTGRVVAGIPFGVESRDNLDKEIFRGENFCTGFPEGYDGTRWTDVSSPEFGYTFVCPPGMFTGYAFKKAEQTIEFIIDRFQPMPKDNFIRVPESLGGTGRHEWWCTLVPHAGNWTDAKSYRQAMEQHVPLLAWSPPFGLDRGGAAAFAGSNKPDRPLEDAASPGVAPLKPSESMVEITPDNVVLSAMRVIEPERPGKPPVIEVRVYETAGKATDVAIRLHRPPASAERTNLLGEPLPQAGAVQIAGSDIRFRIEPWKIVTLRIQIK